MKTYSNCPTCGSHLEVAGDVTKNFVPLDAREVEKLTAALENLREDIVAAKEQRDKCRRCSEWDSFAAEREARKGDIKEMLRWQEEAERRSRRWKDAEIALEAEREAHKVELEKVRASRAPRTLQEVLEIVRLKEALKEESKIRAALQEKVFELEGELESTAVELGHVAERNVLYYDEISDLKRRIEALYMDSIGMKQTGVDTAAKRP